MKTYRLSTVGACATALVAITASAAFAAWTAGGSVTRAGTAGNLNAPTSVSGPAVTNANPVTVSWPASATSASAPSPTGYYVTRTRTSDNATTILCGTFATPVSATSCNDATSGEGTFIYTVTARYQSWSTTSPASEAVIVDRTGPAVTVTTPSADGTTITAASTSFAGAVGTATRDLSPVTVTVLSGSTTVATPTATVSGSGWTTGSVTLTPGNYTVRATQSDSVGNTTTVNRTFTMANPATPAGLSLTAPANVTAGTAFNVTVQALLSDGSNDTSYTGPASGKTLNITGTGLSSPSGATPSMNSIGSWTGGHATVSVTLVKAGSATFTLTDSGTASRTGTTTTAVGAGAANHLAWSLVSNSAGTSSGSCYFACTYTAVGGSGSTFKARVQLTDSVGNAVNASANTTVTVTNSGGGSFSGSAAVTIANGQSVSSTGGDASGSGEITFATGTGSWTSNSLSMSSTPTAYVAATASFAKQ